MKKEIAKRWVKALRSGKYTKNVGSLCEVDAKGKCSYCALGVLVDLYQKTCKKNKKKILSVSHHKIHAPYEYPIIVGYGRKINTAFLPNLVMKWAGMATADGVAIDLDDCTLFPITMMNDDYGWSFKRIATYIEKHYESL